MAKVFPESGHGKMIREWMNADEKSPIVNFVPCSPEIFKALVTIYTSPMTQLWPNGIKGRECSYDTIRGLSTIYITWLDNLHLLKIKVFWI